MARTRPVIAACILHLAILSAQTPADEPPYKRVLTGEDARKAAELQKKSSTLQAEDDFPGAIKAVEELLALSRKVQGADHPDVVDLQWNLDGLRKVAAFSPEKRKEWHSAAVAASQALGEAQQPAAAAKAHDVLVRWLDLCRRIYGEEHPDTAQAMGHLAGNLDDQAKYAEAEALLRKALAIYRKTVGEKHTNTGLCANSLASTLQQRGKYEDAEALFRSARAAFLHSLGEEHPYAMTTLNNLGSNLFARARHAEAEPVFRQVLAMRRKLLGEEDPDTAMAIGNLAAALKGQGKHAEAEAQYRAALNLRKKLHGEDHVETARMYHNLAECLASQGRFSEADPFYRQGLIIREKVRGPGHPETAQSYNGVAYSLQHQGNPGAADPLFRRALAINQKVFGEKHHQTARGYNNLADNLDQQGHSVEAEQLFRRALAIWTEVQGNHPDTARAAENLAYNLVTQRRFAEAETAIRQAHGIRAQLNDAEHVDALLCTRTLAYVLYLRGRPDEAEPLLRQTFASLRTRLGGRHVAMAASCNYLAIVLEKAGKLPEAEAYFRESLAIYRAALGDHHADTAMSRCNLARSLRLQGKYAEAAAAYQDATRSFEAARLGIATTGLERSAFRDDKTSPGADLACCLARGGHHVEAWQAVEAHLGRGLLDDYSARQERSLAPADQKRLDSINAGLGQLEKQIGALLREPERLGEKRFEELARQRRQLQEDQAQFASELGRREVYDLKRIQQRLPNDAALVCWLDASSRPSAADPNGEHWAFVVKAAGAPVSVRLAGSGQDGAWTKEDGDLPDQVRAALRSPERKEPGVLATGLDALRRQRLAPLEPHLRDVRHLIILPSEALAGIPIDALTDRYVVSHAPSGTLLTRLLERRPVSTQQRRAQNVLAVGDPVYAKTQARPGELIASARRGPALAPLPGSRYEAETIAGLFPKSRKLLGPDASKAGLAALEKDLGAFDVIHVGAHGHCNPNVAFNSALVLTQGPGDDGRLTAFEIRDRWKLNADLVVLSACESGLGRYSGGEGYLGFSQPLFLAGARSLILSQWQVSDNATSLLMIRFYENWLGSDSSGRSRSRLAKAEALKEAKHWLRNLSWAEAEKRLKDLPEAARGFETGDAAHGFVASHGQTF